VVIGITCELRHSTISVYISEAHSLYNYHPSCGNFLLPFNVWTKPVF